MVGLVESTALEFENGSSFSTDVTLVLNVFSDNWRKVDNITNWFILSDIVFFILDVDIVDKNSCTEIFHPDSHLRLGRHSLWLDFALKAGEPSGHSTLVATNIIQTAATTRLEAIGSPE